MVFKNGSIPWNKGTKVMVECTCEYCGQIFQIPKAQAKRLEHHTGRFCSKKCFYEAKVKHSLRNKIRPLYEQGKTLREIADILGMNTSSVSSQISRMKIQDRFGDGIYSSVSKVRVKRLLKEWFGFRGCELCGYDRTIDIAHVIEKQKGGEYTIDNCLMLCPNCHHLFDHNLLTDIEKEKLKKISRLNGNLARRLSYESSIR